MTCGEVSKLVSSINVAMYDEVGQGDGAAGANRWIGIPSPGPMARPTSALVVKPGDPVKETRVNCAVTAPVLSSSKVSSAGAAPPQTASPKSIGAAGQPVTTG